MKKWLILGLLAAALVPVVLLVCGFVAIGMTSGMASNRSTRANEPRGRTVDPSALRVLEFTATKTYDETPSDAGPTVRWQVANATTVSLQELGNVPCDPKGLKQAPPVCTGDTMSIWLETLELPMNDPRLRTREAAFAALTEAKSVTLTATSARGEKVTATIEVIATPTPVRYVVTTGGWDGSVTFTNPETGAIEQANVYKTQGGRWSRRYGGFNSIDDGTVLSVTGQNGDKGCVSVQIYVHAVEVKSAHSCGDYKVASVSTHYLTAETLAQLRAGRGQ